MRLVQSKQTWLLFSVSCYDQTANKSKNNIGENKAEEALKQSCDSAPAPRLPPDQPYLCPKRWLPKLGFKDALVRATLPLPRHLVWLLVPSSVAKESNSCLPISCSSLNA